MSGLYRIATGDDGGQDEGGVVRTSLFVIICLCAAVPAAAQSAPLKWWLSPDIQAQLHLTAAQVRTIDAIFESNLSERRLLRQRLDRLEAELRVLLDSATVNDAAATALIERVETARARRNVARTVMLYRIRQVLAPQQRQWFDRRVKSYR